MAIVKTTITGTTWETQFADVLEWLQIYATDYFDTITGDSSTNIITMTYGNASVVLNGITNRITVTLDNGTSNEKSSNDIFITEMYKTDSGIYIHNAKDANDLQLWITKTNAGNTCVLYFYHSSSTVQGYQWADLKASTSLSSFGSNQSQALSSQTRSASLTALTPFVFTGGVYSDNLFLQTFNEYYGISGIFSINRTQYVSNGYIALKD